MPSNTVRVAWRIFLSHFSHILTPLGRVLLVKKDHVTITSMKESFSSHIQSAEDSMVKKERESIARDPELQSTYDGIIEQDNFDHLREKSAAQLTNLEERYFGNLKEDEEAFKQKERKLQLFVEFVEGLTPVRADMDEYAEYVSPERSGTVTSYGPQDKIVHSERFVYGSFAEIGHMMSQGPHQRQLDVRDIAPRAQIVMNDIANVVARTAPNESFVKKYLNNLFDYENGKKILALYLANIFDTPQQAKTLLAGTGGHPQIAQRWEDSLAYYDKTFKGNSADEYIEQKKRSEELTKTFLERMKKILEETGIEPPLSIEIRIKDSAKVLKAL